MSRIAVVGGGVVGLVTARELAQRGFEVALYERAKVGAEASWAGAGVLSPLPPWRYPEPLQRLARLSQAAYPALAQALRADTGVDAEWTVSGLLVLEPPSRAARTWAARAGAAFEALDAAAMQALEPALPAQPALRLGDVAQIRNPRLLRALHADLLRRGVAVHENRPVAALTIRGERVQALDAPGEAAACDAVVLAAGAWSAHLLPEHWRPPVFPVRGQVLLYAAAPGLLGHVVLDAHGYYLVPRRDGHILVGSTVERAGFTRDTTPAAGRELAAAAARLLPPLAQLTPATHWAGLRPGTPDGLPYIGRHPQIANLWIAAGHYRNGLTLAPATAHLLADLIGGRTPQTDPRPFRPARETAPQAAAP
jgi:glycine oxidase